MKALHRPLPGAAVVLLSLAWAGIAQAQGMHDLKPALEQAQQVPFSPEDSQTTYASLVEKPIKQNWRIPRFAKLKLICVVELQIDREGHIQSSRIIQSSGHPDFDNSALRAVRETGNLPPPPPGAIKMELNFNS